MIASADQSQQDEASAVTEAPTSVYHKVLDWSMDKLEPWQQDALRRSVAGEDPTDSAIQFLLQRAIDAAMEPLRDLLVKCSTSDVENQPGSEASNPNVGDAERAPLAPLDHEHIPDSSSAAPPVSIHRVRHVSGVNRLKPGVELDLSPSGLNVIYGFNGSGKSGYTRILKRACHSRLPEPIISDVTKSETQSPVAEIKYSVSGETKVHQWDLEKSSSDENLPRVAVYDLRSGLTSVRRSGSDVIVNAPGIDALQTLINYYTKVASALRISRSLEIAEHSPEILITAQTVHVQAAMKNVGKRGAIGAIERLANLSEQEEALRLSLPSEISNLRDDKTKSAIKSLELSVSQIEREAKLLDLAAELLGPMQMAALRKACGNIETLEAQQDNQVGTELENPHHLSVHGKHWRAMWDAANQYATQEGYPHLDEYPSSEMDRCVLCQQPVSDEARATLDRLSAEASVNIGASLRKAKDERDRLLSSMRQTISAEQLSDTLLDTLLAEQYRVETGEPDDAPAPIFSKVLRAARANLTAIVETADVEPALLELDALATEFVTSAQSLRTLGKAKAGRITQLNKDSTDPKLLEKKTKVLAELEERASLSNHLDSIIQAHNSRIYVQALDAVIVACGTGMVSFAITKFSKDYIDDVCKIFETNLKELSGGEIQVEMLPTGTDKGVRKTALTISKVRSSYGLDSILSEGETRVVALAAFLADVTLLGDRSAMILDDPVTSLDHNYQKAVAARLVKEARDRQVILFTHSSTFTADISASLAMDLAHQHLEGVTVPRKPDFRFIEIARETRSRLAGIQMIGVAHPINNFNGYITALEQALIDVREVHEAGDPVAYLKQVERFAQEMRKAWEIGVEELLIAGVVRRNRQSISTENIIEKLVGITYAEVARVKIGMSDESYYVHSTGELSERAPVAPDVLRERLAELSAWRKTVKDRQKGLSL